MFSQIFVLFVLVTAVFLLGASVGQLLLRIRLAKLEALNLQLDEERLSTLSRAIDSGSIVVEHHGVRFEREVRDEINEMISEIEKE
jgi:Na+/H+ antiporter NhaC